MRSTALGGLTALALLVALTSPPAAASDPPVLAPVSSGPCTAPNGYEAQIRSDGDDPRCTRLRFQHGPLVVRPGQNDFLLGPLVLAQPSREALWTRLDVVLTDPAGDRPSLNDVHLSHARWSTPAHGVVHETGEEGTPAVLPEGYGIPTSPEDPWSLAYVIHNTGAVPAVVHIVWELDVFEDGATDQAPVRPLRLTPHGEEPFAPGARHRPVRPTFNVERGFGSADVETGAKVCVFPASDCASHDPDGAASPQQGSPSPGVAGALHGVPDDGTLVGLVAQLHPGALRVEVDLVRGAAARPIAIADAVYWDRDDPSRAGGPPSTWDLATAAPSASLGWRVAVREGDQLRLNVVQTADHASWYDTSASVIAYLAPMEQATDPFDPSVEPDHGLPTTASWPAGFGDGWTSPPGACAPDAGTLCLRGQVLRGHRPEASNFGGCPPRGCAPLPGGEGPAVDTVVMTNFTYGALDIGTIGLTGIPRVDAETGLHVVNADAATGLRHTVTACALPCTGSSGLAYPRADAAHGADPVNLDSGQIGIGLDTADLSLPAPGDARWETGPLDPGTYAIFCRVHPFMRGAFEVVA